MFTYLRRSIERLDFLSPVTAMFNSFSLMHKLFDESIDRFLFSWIGDERKRFHRRFSRLDCNL